MSKVSDARIALAAVRGGFPADEIATAVAINLAESGGDPLAVGVNNGGPAPGSRDLGGWQLNDHYWAALLALHDWRDLDQNALMACDIWRDAGQSWTPWATFKSESYVKFLTRGQAAHRGLYRFTLRRYLFNHPQARSKDQLDHGSDVLALQRAIGMAHGDQDGYFGPVTERHVKQFQGNHGLATDGVAGPRTAKALGWGWQG